MKSILVVDDVHDVADATAALLNVSGYETRIAFNGREAIAAASQARPDVVLLDLNMPVVDGFEAAPALRALYPNNPPVIVALSAVTELSTTAVLEACGFDHYMSKPLDVERLTKILQES